MKLPRDMDAAQLTKALERIGYRVVRQTGSHIRMQCDQPVHSITVPNHRPIRIGTLSSIVTDLATRWRLDREEMLERLLR